MSEALFDAWRSALGRWSIPEEILSQAPESPWIHPVELFEVDGEIPDSPSHRAARTALGRSLLDVGCGGGRAAFACVPPARHVIGVDHQPVMLERFREQAHARGVTVETVLGDWPAVADRTPIADVVTCHHVLYNVADLEPFVRALSDHARRRVVVELPEQHPLADMAPWWRHFWDLGRPDGPTAQDAADAIGSLGFDVQVEQHQPSPTPAAADEDTLVRFMRIRLCLPASRDGEVREFMRAQPVRARTNVTLWWDVT